MQLHTTQAGIINIQTMAATVSTSTNTHHHGPSLVDDTLKRLQNLKNVQHVLILTKDGVALRSTLSPVRAQQRRHCAACVCFVCVWEEGMLGVDDGRGG